MLLAVIVLAVFLVTRKSVRPANRYQVGVDVLIPAVDSKGARAARRPRQPAARTSGARAQQEHRRQSARYRERSEERSLRHRIRVRDHGNAAASSCTGNCSNVVTLSATANDSKTANNVANAFQAAYSQARAKTVADSATSSQDSTLAGIKLLTDKLIATNQSIRKADPTLLDRLPKEPQKSAAALTASLPAGTSDATSLLVVQRNTLLSGTSDARRTTRTTSSTPWSRRRTHRGCRCSHRRRSLLRCRRLAFRSSRSSASGCPGARYTDPARPARSLDPHAEGSRGRTRRDRLDDDPARYPPHAPLVRPARFDREGGIPALAATAIATDRLPKPSS